MTSQGGYPGGSGPRGPVLLPAAEPAVRGAAHEGGVQGPREAARPPLRGRAQVRLGLLRVGIGRT